MVFAVGKADTSLISQALSASNVGVWEWEVASDTMRVDANCALLFGLPASDAERGLPLHCATDAIHPEDLPRFENRIAEVVENGGLFLAEYRTCPRPGEVRWVLARGRFEADPSGAVVRGRGIIIDITESKHDGHIDNDFVFMSMSSEGELKPLHRATDAALVAYRELEQMNKEGEHLREAARVLLQALGHELAKSTPKHEVAPTRFIRRKTH